jgi:hypothetical protein
LWLLVVVQAVMLKPIKRDVRVVVVLVVLELIFLHILMHHMDHHFQYQFLLIQSLLVLVVLVREVLSERLEIMGLHLILVHQAPQTE